MSNIFKYKGKNFTINRFPKSSNKSLRSWNSSDELVLTYMADNRLKPESLAIYNDKFGFLSCVLNKQKPFMVIDYKSQERAIRSNLDFDELEYDEEKLCTSLDVIPQKIELTIVKVPKSLDLFQLYLQSIHKIVEEKGAVICSFMTKHFLKKMVEIASLYFEDIEQTKAHKKARLMILKSPIKVNDVELINNVALTEKESLKQYYGVFSSNHIDYATQFFMENLVIPNGADIALDLASGNGVLAYTLRKENKELELHLVDDSFLAIESSKMNLKDENTYFHYNNSLEEFQNNFFDFIVSNPPFHFEHETNIEISLKLFKEAKRCLKKGGSFQLVANQHLNYKTHLIKFFDAVNIVSENEKFVIYKCIK